MYPDEEVRVRPSATPAELIAEGVPFPEQPPDVLRNVAATRSPKTPSSAAAHPVGVTFSYNAGPHLALESVRLQLIPADEVTDPAGEVHPMRHVQNGAFAVRLEMDPSEARKTYRWRVLANVSGPGAGGNAADSCRVLQDERVTFGAKDPQFTLQGSDSTVRYNAVSYDRMGAVLGEDGRLTMRVAAPQALRVTLKYWDAQGAEQRIPLQRDSRAAPQRSAAPQARSAMAPPPTQAEASPTWTTQVSREASAALLNRPYLFEIDDREVTDPYARAVTVLEAQERAGGSAEVRRSAAAQVVKTAHAFENDAVPRTQETRTGITCRVDLSRIFTLQPESTQAAGASPLAQMRQKLPALESLGIGTLELNNLTPANAAGLRVQRNLAIDPAHGTPQELQALVDTAHGLGLNVVLGAQYDANAADRPADAEFIRNHAIYQLDTFHADGLRVAVSRGDAPDDTAQVNEITRQLGCLRTHVLGDDGKAPSNLVHHAVNALASGTRVDLASLQEALGVRSAGAVAATAVGPPAQSAAPDLRHPMTAGQARLAVALGLLTASDAGLPDSIDLGGFGWSPTEHGMAERAVRALAPDLPLEDWVFSQNLRKKFEHLLAVNQQTRQTDPLFKGLGITDQLVLALLAVLSPQASRRAMNDMSRRHMDRFSYDMVRLRKKWPSLFDAAAAANTESLCLHAETGVGVTAHGGRFVVVTNTGEQNHDSYSVPLPPGRWQRVLHSEAQCYGGAEANPETTPSLRGGLPRPMRLPAHSVQIFACVDT